MIGGSRFYIPSRIIYEVSSGYHCCHGSLRSRVVCILIIESLSVVIGDLSVVIVRLKVRVEPVVAVLGRVTVSSTDLTRYLGLSLWHLERIEWLKILSASSSSSVARVGGETLSSFASVILKSSIEVSTSISCLHKIHRNCIACLYFIIVQNLDLTFPFQPIFLSQEQGFDLIYRVGFHFRKNGSDDGFILIWEAIKYGFYAIINQNGISNCS